MDDKLLIDIMAKSYRQHKIILKECEMGYRQYSNYEIKNSSYIVSHIEMVTDYLNERDRFIIQHEVILGLKGKWYREHLSEPSYYRHRKQAYRTFLHNLDA